MADKSGYRTVIRVLEMHGSVEWLEKTLAASRIPIQGALNLPQGCFIRSGIVSWQPDVVTEAQVNGDGNKVSNPQPVKTVPFKRPGE
jgi:hypothetical protein